MSSTVGNKLKVQLFGQSHSEALGVVIDGLPAGHRIDLPRVQAFLDRRKGGQNRYTTQRVEADAPHILCGVVDDVTCGAPLCAVFDNANVKRKDYADMARIFRPSHADYTAHVKHGGHNDGSGGGHFSGRLTLPLCFAGAVCMQVLEPRGIAIAARMVRVGGETDASRMVEAMERAAQEGDSVGGIIECVIDGMPVGYGDPFFDTLESRLAYAMFAVPAVKGVEFGAGFAAADMRGSICNDAFYAEDGAVATRTNHSGGIQGGISNGMPIVLRVAVKPTPSIGMAQDTLDFASMEQTTLVIKGRHDPCIVPRAVPCIEAAAAITICDIILGG